jgi:hypothetical protein
MAKKSRRARKKGRQVRLSPTQMARPEADETADLFPGIVRAHPAPGTAGLEEEYRYVVADLKRIGLIAAAILVALTVLAFLLA